MTDGQFFVLMVAAASLAILVGVAAVAVGRQLYRAIKRELAWRRFEQGR